MSAGTKAMLTGGESLLEAEESVRTTAIKMPDGYDLVTTLTDTTGAVYLIAAGKDVPAMRLVPTDTAEVRWERLWVYPADN